MKSTASVYLSNNESQIIADEDQILAGIDEQIGFKQNKKAMLNSSLRQLRQARKIIFARRLITDSTV